MEEILVNRRIGPRKHLSARQKLEIVYESYESDKQVSEIARQHNVGVSSFVKWGRLEVYRNSMKRHHLRWNIIAGLINMQCGF